MNLDYLKAHRMINSDLSDLLHVSLIEKEYKRNRGGRGRGCGRGRGRGSGSNNIISTDELNSECINRCCFNSKVNKDILESKVNTIRFHFDRPFIDIIKIWNDNRGTDSSQRANYFKSRRKLVSAAEILK